MNTNLQRDVAANSECFISGNITESKSSNSHQCDHGFMGTTHALSAVAVLFALCAFSTFLPWDIALLSGVTSFWILMLFSANTVGAAMICDADNTNSSFESSLGLFGSLVSAIFRSTSTIIQTTIRTSRDDPEPNPHRGFYHTPFASILIGIAAWFLAGSHWFSVSFPILGTMASGKVFAIVFSWLNLHVAFSTLAKSSMKKIRKSSIFGETIAFVLSLTTVVLIFTQIPANQSVHWIGIAIAAGMITHILGDCFTIYGAPILFPLRYRGKLWWTVRFARVRTNGPAENFFQFLFATIIVVSSIVFYVKM